MKKRAVEKGMALFLAITFFATMGILLVALLSGCAGGSSSGNYHNTFRPATGAPGSVN